MMNVQCKKRSAFERSGKEDLMVLPKKSKVSYERRTDIWIGSAQVDDPRHIWIFKRKKYCYCFVSFIFGSWFLVSRAIVSL